MNDLEITSDFRLMNDLELVNVLELANDHELCLFPIWTLVSELGILN